MTPDGLTMPSRPGWLGVFGVNGHHRPDGGDAALPQPWRKQAAHDRYGFVQMLYESPRGHQALACVNMGGGRSFIPPWHQAWCELRPFAHPSNCGRPQHTDVTRRHPTQLRSRRHACGPCLEVIRVGPRLRWLAGAAMLRTGLPQL
jgi:hypothetical protein